MELAASFMDELQDQIKAYKSQNSHIIESVVEKKTFDVMLRRIFCLMWNPNGDDVCTVYEVNEATKRFGPSTDSVALTFTCMKNLEMEFYKQIAFYPLGSKDHGTTPPLYTPTVSPLSQKLQYYITITATATPTLLNTLYFFFVKQANRAQKTIFW